MDRLWLNLYPIDSWKRKRDGMSEFVQGTPPKDKMPSKSFPLMSLPTELRLHVLSFTDLATKNPDQDTDGNVELRMVEDRPKVRRPFASAASDGLFLASKTLRAEAIETMMAGNRLMLVDCNCEWPDPRCALLCLQSLTPQILRRVPALDIRLRVAWLLDTIGDVEHGHFNQTWSELIKFVASTFSVGRLGLTIDASWEHEAIEEMGITKHRLDAYGVFYRQLAEPLVYLKELRRFRIFLACNCQLEDEIWSKVMSRDETDSK